MVKVKKLFGEFPDKVTVLAELVSFDAEGDAEVSEEIAEILAQIPGYEVESAFEVDDKAPEGGEGNGEGDEDTDPATLEAGVAPDASEAPKLPKKPAKAKPAPKTE